MDAFAKAFWRKGCRILINRCIPSGVLATRPSHRQADDTEEGEGALRNDQEESHPQADAPSGAFTGDSDCYSLSTRQLDCLPGHARAATSPIILAGGPDRRRGSEPDTWREGSSADRGAAGARLDRGKKPHDAAPKKSGLYQCTLPGCEKPELVDSATPRCDFTARLIDYHWKSRRFGCS